MDLVHHDRSLSPRMNGSPGGSGGRVRDRSRSGSRGRRGGEGGHRRSFSRSGSREKKYRRHSRSPMGRPSYGSSPRRYGGGGGSRGSSRYMQQQDNPRPNKCLGVFGLSLRTTERDLRDVFSRYGPIEECSVIIDAQSGRSRGFAFIYFDSVDDAKAAKESCNGIEIDGRRIRVDFSITERAHTPTPGIYMGKPTMNGRYRGSRDFNDRRGRRDDYRGFRRSPSPYYQRRSSRRSRSYSPRLPYLMSESL